MPHFRASRHAIARLGERFPLLTAVAGQGRAAGAWLARIATRATVAGQQAGLDLLLAVELPTIAGPVRLFLPVTPHLGGDWIIRTVLTEDQAPANLAACADAQRAAWRVRKGFIRPYARRAQSAHRALEVAA